jgi:serine/threonine protein kinase
MIHRDIKPSNVLIDERGNCLLTDFGLARMAEASSKLTSSGAVMGTPAYMAPEQGSGSSIDHRSDLYALGVIFYELTTGRVPYTAETPIAVVFKHISDPLPSARKINPDLDENVELVLYKALAKNPDDRYQTAEDFMHAVQSAIPDKPANREPSKIIQAESRTLSPASQPHMDSGKTTGSSKTSTKVIIAILSLIGIILVCGIAIMGFRRIQARNNKTASSQATKSSVPITAVPTLIPSPTQEPTSEIPAPAGETFTDDFNGQLSDGWDWIAEDPATWSLSEAPGYLQIIASDASINGSASPTNILFRYTGAENFEAITLLRYAPRINYQFAGFIIFQDGNNALQFGRGFCDNPDQCAGDGLYFDSIIDTQFENSNFKTAISGNEVYLRLRRAGNLYSASYSMDGENWIEIGEHEREFTTVNIGLIAAQAPTPIAAQFDYFTLNEFP